MPEQLNFGVARIGEAARFFQNICAGTAALRSSSEWNHAIRTRFVATFDDGDVRAKWMIAARHFSFKSFVGIVIEPGNAAIPCFEFLNHAVQFAVARGTAHQADPRRALENFFALLLRHAAEDTDNFSVVGIAEFAEPRKNLMRGFFADTASVVEHHRCGRDRFYLAITALQQHASDFFGVVRIHLAAKCFEIKSFAGGRRSRIRRPDGRLTCWRCAFSRKFLRARAARETLKAHIDLLAHNLNYLITRKRRQFVECESVILRTRLSNTGRAPPAFAYEGLLISRRTAFC